MNPPIPNKLRLHRKKAGLLQVEVARILGLGKRGSDSILRWEKGYSLPTIENLFKLSVLYGVLPEELYPELVQQIGKKMHGRKREK